MTTNTIAALQHPTPGMWTETASDAHIANQLETRHQDTPPVLPDGAVFPLAVKANIAVTGFQCSAGSKALAGHQALTDAPVVAALRAAGAVVVGATNMHELAFGITSNNASYGQVVLPGHSSRGAGGSSGGSAAAVAEGTVDIALGTDTGGSVSIPASHCGVFGFRPTTGRWPTAGTIGLSWTRDTPGVFTRTLEQAAQADTWITGQGSAPLTTDPVRLGIPRQFMTGLDPHTAEVVRRTVTTLADHIQVVEIDYEPILALTGPTEMPTVLWEAKRLLASAAAEVLNTTPEQGFNQLADQVASPDVAALLQGQCQDPVPAEAYRQAQREVVQARAAYAQLLADHGLDALIFPAAPAPAPPVGTTDMVEHLGETTSAFLLHTRHTGQGTMLAAPMVTIPLPVPDDGLPIGMTIQGLRFADRQVLGIAQRLVELLEG